MFVGDILRTNRAPAVTIGSSETVSIAANLMYASNVGALVVRNVSRSVDAAVVGMFSERDVVAVIAERGTGGLAAKVAQFISPRPLVSCTSQHSLTEVEHMMGRHDVRHIPVIDNGRLVGVVSMRDISLAFEEADCAA
ncbi:histidine kinase [Paenibacillus jamilae]|jgi:CBS domain-containing protein|uniref:CBS domain-containing protein n=2 Tax=Bacteria TaxID=2 RepID=A0AAX2TLW5_NEIGO|nr:MULTISPECIES: CBS domain-containing protein [Bacteria]ERF85113.1 MAG: UDP-GlcNAc3NAcA epimerase [Bradyrhizobium sp. DFCI-1]OYU61591.1 MAG: histidine kinase [Bradyrhizobium sp. PARBB1]PSO27276.1 CBS domain-containing protein [Bradyrhizobium sp. MOS004]QRI67273.1 CBS domain-containing protein [Bradyrhizobium sp. PSBB068]TJX03174.1 CBS domain-containing protein [Neisseria gonorrhoeae]